MATKTKTKGAPAAPNPAVKATPEPATKAKGKTKGK